MAYYGCDRRFVLPCVLNLYFLCKFKSAVDEYTEQQKLFVLQTSTAKSLSCTDYEIITKAVGNIVATAVAHIVKVFTIMVQFSIPAHSTLSNH
jgi:hypothetical protein